MNCATCNIELERIFPETNRRRNDNESYVDALTITFSSGYNQYFDEELQKVHLCSSCAQNLFLTNPDINPVIEP